eukprot:5939242-Amphidinium_carterae.1
MRSCPIERRPSARLQPPVLQAHTRGPGFLASPILATGVHQGRSSQAITMPGRQSCKCALTTSGHIGILRTTGRSSQASAVAVQLFPKASKP